MQARLGPQLENLARKLATEIKRSCTNGPRSFASMPATLRVSKLRELLDREPGFAIDLRYVSNQHSLVSLAQGACDLSGFHLPRASCARKASRRSGMARSAGRPRSSVRHPRDGAMVKRGNPLRIDHCRTW